MNYKICTCEIFFISLHPISVLVLNNRNVICQIVNNMNERDRVLQVMQSEGMNAKQFCREVGISQGTLSNIMGGRNKPSLDVLQAILRRFRAVSCDWLIMGVGTMYIAGAREEGVLPLFGDDRREAVTPIAAGQSEPIEEKQPIVAASPLQTIASPQRTVSKILVFYSDGTFEER